MTGGKGVDQFNVTSAQTVAITDLNTNSQTDTFNLTSTAAAVNITVKKDFTATTSHINNAGGTVTLTPDGAGTDINLTNALGDTGYTIAAGTNVASTKSILTGSKNNDSITAAASGSTITGGKGIDTVVGGAGTDTFVQTVGDSAAATATNLAADTLTANCTITFGNKVDLLTTFTTTTDKIDLASASATPLQATNNVNSLTIGNNYIIRGALVVNTGVFTQDDGGNDYLLFTAAGTTLNGQASAFGTNAIIGQARAIAGTDII